ncbi:hypothetical protein LJR030_004967 [Rhizobium sp. LjRoot30]|uniref:hypothetical protein n=1 Tax=Rhizobium sp. LjRoot30 TaxID=3342320 RepID=UPI003ED11FA9
MTSLAPISRSSSPERFVPISGSVKSPARFIDRVRDGWSRWKTERAIEAMPADMRKDIGWPTTDIRTPAGNR